MPERWPAVMRMQTAAEYLDSSVSEFKRVADAGEIPAMTLNDRGERLWAKSDLDDFIERRRNRPVVRLRRTG